MGASKCEIATHTGHLLTQKQAMFIACYMESGNATQAVIDAGYNNANPNGFASELMRKPYIKEEINYRLKQLHASKIASGHDVMEFFTKVMNGEVKDQFGLDAALADRLKAAYEIAKRTIDIENKVNENEIKVVIERRKTPKRKKKEEE